MADRLELSYFSDVLCVWAYVSQIRLDELRRNHPDEITVRYHFIPIFGCTERRIGERWKDRGGFAGYAAHVAEVCARFDHVAPSGAAWDTVRPTGCGPAHEFLQALQLLEREGTVSARPEEEFSGRTLFEEAVWRMRCAFFEEGRDVSSRDTLWEVTADLDLPVAAMQARLADGSALAELFRDVELRDQHKVEGSPTYLLNKGRQKLYGNLGYKVIEANVEEVLRRPAHVASWC